MNEMSEMCLSQHNINLDPVFVLNALLVCTYVVRFNLIIVVNMYVGQCEAFSTDFFVIVHIRSRAFFSVGTCLCDSSPFWSYEDQSTSCGWFWGISQQKGFGKFRNAGSGPRIIIASTAIYYSFSHRPLQLWPEWITEIEKFPRADSLFPGSRQTTDPSLPNKTLSLV